MVSTCTPLAPANLFLGHNQEKWLESEEREKIIYYKRYVDDMFCILENENEANICFAILEYQISEHEI